MSKGIGFAGLALFGVIVLAILISLFPSIFRKNRAFQSDSQAAKIAKLPKSEFGSWVAYWDEESSIKSLNLGAHRLRNISPVWYRLDESGALMQTNSLKRREIIDLASSSALLLTPTINNEFPGGFDSERVSILLNDKNKTKEFIKNLTLLAQKNHYSGWDIDWEEIKESDKISFLDFIRQLSMELHGNRLLLSVTVHAQTGANDWIGTKGQDIKILSTYADEIRVMAYDFHNVNSNPGAISPLNWLEDVVEYSLASVPENKLVIGLPTYGYHWAKDEGKSVQYFEAMETISEHNLTTTRDTASWELKAEFLNNGNKHYLWFQDAESIRKKIETCRELGVYKFYFWRLGKEDGALWDLE
jgi:spore germination protein YaaH